MKKIRNTKNQQKKEDRQLSFFTGVVAEAKERGKGSGTSKKKHVVVDMDDMFGNPEAEEETRSTQSSKRSKRKTKRKTNASTSSTLPGTEGYSTTTIEAMFGSSDNEEFAFDNPLAQEVVYDVITSGGSVKKVARKLFMLEQLRHKAPADKSPDFVKEEEPKKRKPRKSKVKVK